MKYLELFWKGGIHWVPSKLTHQMLYENVSCFFLRYFRC